MKPNTSLLPQTPDAASTSATDGLEDSEQLLSRREVKISLGVVGLLMIVLGVLVSQRWSGEPKKVPAAAKGKPTGAAVAAKPNTKTATPTLGMDAAPTIPATADTAPSTEEMAPSIEELPSVAVRTPEELQSDTSEGATQTPWHASPDEAAMESATLVPEEATSEFPDVDRIADAPSGGIAWPDNPALHDDGRAADNEPPLEGPPLSDVASEPVSEPIGPAVEASEPVAMPGGGDTTFARDADSPFDATPAEPPLDESRQGQSTNQLEEGHSGEHRAGQWHSTPAARDSDIRDAAPPIDFSTPSDGLAAPNRSLRGPLNDRVTLEPLPPTEPSRAADADEGFRPNAPIEPSTATNVHPVVAGDTFWSISKESYGTGAYFQALAEFNSGLVPSGQAPSAGQTLRIPPAQELEQRYPDLCPTVAQLRRPGEIEPGSATAGANRVLPRGQRTYVVKAGENLYDVAERELGSPLRWKDIYELNRKQLGDRPHDLRAGMELILPVQGERSAASPRIRPR